MIDTIYKYIKGGYDKRATPRVAIEVGIINPVENFVKTKSIKGDRNTYNSVVFVDNKYRNRFKIGSLIFEAKIFSENEIDYINQVKYAEIPNAIKIKSINCLTDNIPSIGNGWLQNSLVGVELSNGVQAQIKGSNTEIYKRVWHYLEYQAYLKYPELFTDKI